MRHPNSWTFRVSTNPVYWTVSNTNQTAYQGESRSFTRTLKNSGNQDESFTITGYPNWLTPSPLIGTIPPDGEQNISFSINTQLNVGSYQDTIVVSNSYGEEQLLANLTILKEPPLWAVNPAQYSNSMNITAQVVLNNSLSEDVFDKLSVFIDNECRGVANIEYVSPVDKYLAFLTIYSNTNSGEP